VKPLFLLLSIHLNFANSSFKTRHQRWLSKRGRDRQSRHPVVRHRRSGPRLGVSDQVADASALAERFTAIQTLQVSAPVMDRAR
jgi:hypothetical protein